MSSEAPAAKKAKLDDDNVPSSQASSSTASSSACLLEPTFTVEYPHGAHTVRCIIATSPNEVITGSRREVKVWRRRQDSDKVEWKCHHTIKRWNWDEGNPRSRGGPFEMCLLAGNNKSNNSGVGKNDSNNGSKHGFLVVGEQLGDIVVFSAETWNHYATLEFRGPRNKPRDLTCLVALDDETFLGGYLNGNVNLWGLKRNGCNSDEDDDEDDVTFIAAPGGRKKPHDGRTVWSMAVLKREGMNSSSSHPQIVTGSEDNSFKIWELRHIERRGNKLGPAYRSWSCLHTVNVNEGYVVQLALCGDMLLSDHELGKCAEEEGGRNLARYLFGIKHRMKVGRRKSGSRHQIRRTR